MTKTIIDYQKMDEVNIKQQYEDQIVKRRNIIKSLKYIKSSKAVEDEITTTKKEISILKSEYKIRKKRIYSDSKAKTSEYSIAYRSLKKYFNEQKRTCDKQTYENLKNELVNLKLRKKSAASEKYRKVYGSSEGKTRSERTSTWTRVAIIVAIFVLFMIPIWLIISYSTKTNVQAASTTTGSIFVPSTTGGAKINYDLAIKNLEFWRSLTNTLFLTIFSNILILLFASMAAWQLVRKQTWYSKVIFYFFVVAMILPFQAIMIPMISQLTKTRMTGSLLGTSIAYIGFGMALSIFMMHGFLKTVPKALEESATISGMNPFQVFFHVVLPMLRTTFVTILVLNIMWIWNDYLLPSLMLSDPYGPQTLQVRLIDSLVSAVASDLKALSAGVVLLLIPPITFFVFAQKKMISGITKGAIK